ncbi:MAG: acyl carrier protein [Candidatus Nanopelagicales bacterium]|nr:acyl carrier protein [Candidatus Nanopelagicales bacterium]
MIEAVSAAMARVLGHDVVVRADTPLSAFGQWSSLAVLVAAALQESTGVTLADATLAGASTVGDIVTALEAGSA